MSTPVVKRRADSKPSGRDTTSPCHVASGDALEAAKNPGVAGVNSDPWVRCIDCARFTAKAGVFGKCAERSLPNLEPFGLTDPWWDGMAVRQCKGFA